MTSAEASPTADAAAPTDTRRAAPQISVRRSPANRAAAIAAEKTVIAMAASWALPPRLSLMRTPLQSPADPSATSPHMATKPVSYTHLRAHETVLDLVCRLLLEKK